MLSPGPVTFKAKPPVQPLPSLATHGLLAVEGPDARAFLQAQLMNDVRSLDAGQWQWNGWLTAKGRVVALMALLCTTADRFVLVLPDFPARELQARLQRYVFRSKVTLSTLAEWTCAAQFDDAVVGDAPAELATGDDTAGWRLDMSGTSDRRALWLLPPGSALAAPPDAVSSGRWFALDLAHGLPRLPPDGVEAWTPQMLSLERLRAFSLSKGCYPGQEIVARTHYLGKAKRGLALLEGEHFAPGQVLRDAAGVDVGQLACASPDGRLALGVVQREHEHGPLHAAENPVNARPLSTGLARPL
jgi:tRNA-modifying protein YgfZ